jgi:general secretion pathway protein G
MKRARGFTLVELLITVTILALLASVAMPLAEVAVQRSKEKELRQSLREMRDAIDAWKRAADEGRIEKPADGSGYPPSLAALVEGATDKTKPDGPKVYFLRRVPRDPMGEEPMGEEQWGLRAYDSPADSPRPGKDVYDVYTKSEETGLNGVPYKKW